MTFSSSTTSALAAPAGEAVVVEVAAAPTLVAMRLPRAVTHPVLRQPALGAGAMQLARLQALDAAAVAAVDAAVVVAAARAIQRTIDRPRFRSPRSTRSVRARLMPQVRRR